jgi:hypothetical protein
MLLATAHLRASLFFFFLSSVPTVGDTFFSLLIVFFFNFFLWQRHHRPHKHIQHARAVRENCLSFLNEQATFFSISFFFDNVLVAFFSFFKRIQKFDETGHTFFASN